MARIDCQYRVAERECGRTDQEIGERNHDAVALLLGVQLASKSCCIGGQGIDGHRSEELLDEGLAARAAFGRVGSVDAMNEFNDGDRRQGRLLIAGGINRALEKRLKGVAAALGRNRDTRIEDQSHAGGVRGSRWLLTTASRSLPNSPSRVALEPRSFAS